MNATVKDVMTTHELAVLRAATMTPVPAYALLTDGSTVQIRTAEPGDYEAVKAMHEAMSPDNIYLRFFNASPLCAGREAHRVCREHGNGHADLLAVYDEQIVGCASYESLKGRKAAEVAFAVADRMHHRGIATLLLEHLVAQARHDGIPAFVATTLAENTEMLHVFAHVGLPVQRRLEDGVFEVTVPVPSEGPDEFLSAVERREGSADIASLPSLRHIFAPASVAVIGASRRKGTAGRAILDNIHNDGFQGPLCAVNPHARYLGGVKCVPSVAELPETPELAVIAVPPPRVTQVVEACGARGVKALVVITAGLDTGACADLLAICRRHGIRLIGPNCFGVAVPSIGLNATFAASHPAAGKAGLVVQSGGIGFALVDQLSRLGIGISSFASVGNKLDVSSNDLLMWWEHDGVTKLAIMYIESFGNPRKFGRTARRVGATMPVLTVHAGRSAIGQRAAAASHTGAIATPLASRQALFEQAGIIATPGVGELTEVAALLATQPVLAGRTVALISNVGGAGVLAADACVERGLTVHQPHGTLKRRLGALTPDGAAVSGPVIPGGRGSGDGPRRRLRSMACHPARRDPRVP